MGAHHQDDDFVERSLDSTDGPSIVWLRIGNCTNRVLFAWLEPLLPEILRQLESGHRIVEVRRCKTGRPMITGRAIGQKGRTLVVLFGAVKVPADFDERAAIADELLKKHGIQK